VLRRLPATGPFRTRTSLTVTPNRVTFGQPVTLTAAVKNLLPAGAAPGGNVSFFDGRTFLGSVTLTDGNASLTTRALPIGKNAIRVVYMGTADFKRSASRSLVESVSRQGNGTAQALHSRTIPRGGYALAGHKPLLRRQAGESGTGPILTISAPEKR
jgi:hypothetical protein